MSEFEEGNTGNDNSDAFDLDAGVADIAEGLGFGSGDDDSSESRQESVKH